MNYVPHALLLGVILSVLSGFGGYQKGKEAASDKAEVERLKREVVSLSTALDRQKKTHQDAQEILNEMWAENASIQVVTKTVVKEVPVHVIPEKDISCAIDYGLVELLNSTRGYVESHPGAGQRPAEETGSGAEAGAGED